MEAVFTLINFTDDCETLAFYNKHAPPCAEQARNFHRRWVKSHTPRSAGLEGAASAPCSSVIIQAIGTRANSATSDYNGTPRASDGVFSH